MIRPFADGERVLLVDSKQRRYLVNLSAGGEFHSHAGIIGHDEIIGRAEGIELSHWAVENSAPGAQGHVRQGSLTERLPWPDDSFDDWGDVDNLLDDLDFDL